MVPYIPIEIDREKRSGVVVLYCDYKDAAGITKRLNAWAKEYETADRSSRIAESSAKFEAYYRSLGLE